MLTRVLVLPCELLHLILHYLLLMHEIDRLVDMRWVDHCWLVHVLFLLGKLHGIHLLEVLIFLSQNHVLVHYLAILLRCQRHLVPVDDLLPVLKLLTFSLELDFLLDELLLLLELVGVKLVGVVLLMGRNLLVGVIPGRLLLRILRLEKGSWIMLHW